MVTDDLSDGRIAAVVSYFASMLAGLDVKWRTKFEESVYKATLLVEGLLPQLEPETRLMREQAGQMRTAHQVATAIAGIVFGAALIIGFFVIASIDDAIPSISNANLSADRTSTVDRIGDGMLIGGVAIIVIFAALILRVLRGL